MIHRGERLGIKGNGSKEDLDLIERAVSNCQSSHHAPVRLVIGEPDEEDLAGAAEEKFTLLVLPAGGIPVRPADLQLHESGTAAYGRGSKDLSRVTSSATSGT
jgi:hypothetical protein